MKDVRYIILLLLFTAIMGCENNVQTQECIDNPVNFISLTAASDSIESGMSTLITAVAEGYKLTYKWKADRGYISPEDEPNIVKYSASPCAIGEIIVTCTITDDCDNSLSKDVKIIVL